MRGGYTQGMPPLTKFGLCALLGLGASALADDVARQDTTLNFGDFTSPAQWTYPASARGKVPAVLLIHGSTPADMDFTVTGPDGKPLSNIFRDISGALSARGVAVLRYNKHYVAGPGKVDYEKFYGQADLKTFLKDAETALDAMKRNPRVDPRRIFVYGWSEGSTVAARLVRDHPEVRGLILQGPVTLPWGELFDKQLTNVQLPYLRQVAPGGLTNANVMAALSGPGGLVARSGVSFALSPESFSSGQPSLNPALDLNRDGIIDLDREYLPGVRAYLKSQLDTPQGFLNIYSDARSLPPVTAQVPYLKVPMLIVQGMNDANTPEPYLMTLQQAIVQAKGRATIKRYAGLGHSLGPASSVIDDSFRPIAQQPLNDMAEWILRQ